MPVTNLQEFHSQNVERDVATLAPEINASYEELYKIPVVTMTSIASIHNSKTFARPSTAAPA